MMLVSLRRLLDLVLFSNVFIACCAMAQGGLTYLILSLPVNYTVVGIIGCATLALYNFSMILAKPEHPGSSPYRRVRWIFAHERSLWVWTGIALAVSLGFALSLHAMSFLLLGIMGVMGLAYNLPIIQPIGRRWMGLRQVPGLKLFYIGLVWAMSCVLLPVTEAYHGGYPVVWTQALQVMCWVFLFVVAVTIPFDIRDVYQDKHYGLKTLPVMFGERSSLTLSGLLLLVHMGWIGWSDYATGIRGALAAVSLVCLLAILFPPKEKNEYYYFLLLDGMMLLQFLAVYAMM